MKYSLSQRVASIITIILFIGTWLICIYIVPDLLGLPSDSFKTDVIVYLIGFGLMYGILMIMKPFLQKKPDRSGGRGDGRGYGSGDDDGGGYGDGGDYGDGGGDGD